jgi:hypothetical protein
VHSPLSTFNSNRRRRAAFRVTVTTTALTLLLLGVLNYAVNEMLRPYLPQTRMGMVVRYLRSMETHPPAPTVLFLGSSRFHSAILTSVFDAEFRGRGIRFLNCSQPSIESWEFSRILQCVDLRALRVRVCIVEVDPWSFSKYSCHPVTKEVQKYRRELDIWGTFRDIMAVEDPLVKGELLFRRYVPRRSLSELIRTAYIWRALRGCDATLSPPRYHGDADAEAERRADSNFRPEKIARCHMLNYTFSRACATQFIRFIGELSQAGITVVVVHPPVVAGYYDYVRVDPRREREFLKHMRFLDVIGSRYSFVNWQRPEDAGLTPDAFIDYGHLSLSGARQFSAALATQTKAVIEQGVARGGL